MAKGWFRDLLTPMKPTETTSREWVNFFRKWVDFVREAFFILSVRLYLFFFLQFDPSESVDFFREAFSIPLLRLYLFFFLQFCLGYFLQFDPSDVVLSGYLCYLVITTLKKLIYLQNAETPSRAFFAPISIHAGILGLLLSLPSPRHFITSFDPPLFVLDGLIFSYYCLIGLSLLLSVQILKKIMKPMLKTLEISLKNKGIISVSSKFESGKNREQKPLVDFDSTNNRAYQSGLLVPNSDKTTTREASKGPCMTEGALGLVDPTTRISSTDFDSEKKDLSERLNGECLSESVLSLDDSTKRKSFPDFDATENKAHHVRSHQSGPVVSLSENKNKGETLKRECITKSILAAEDLQQHCGGRPDAAAKSFRVARHPDQHGEKNTSTACEVPSHNVETGMEIEPIGQNQEANVFRRDFTEGPTALNTENGLMIGIVKTPPFHDSYPGNYPIDYKESENAGSSSEWASQVNDQSTLSTPYQNHNALVFPQPQITTMLSENRGGSIDWRNSLASQAEHFSDTHISESLWRPRDQLEGQTMQFTAHPNRNAQIASSQVPSANQDRRNSLASQVEAFFMGRVSESSNLAFPEYSDTAAPSQPVAPILKERQDTWSVKVKVTYGDSIIKFLPLLTSGIKELMQEVSLTLDCVLGSFNFDYMDEDDYMDVDEDCFTTPCEFNGPPFTSEILQQYFGHKRKDVAASLGVSVSTFKRKCRQQGIMRWPNGMGSSGSVSKPPDQHGERNTSTACETPSHYVQTGMEGELFGQNEMANVFPRDFMGGPIALDTESGLIMVSRPPDQHGERNTSTACGTPSHNVETGMEVEPVGQNQEANVFHQDFMYGPIALNTDGLRFPECSDAVAPSQPMATILDTIPHLNGGSSECAFQVKNQSTQFTANPYPNGLVDPHPQIALTQILSEDMERLEDRRNLLAPRKEPLLEGHVFGSVNRTVRSCSDVALSQPMPTIPDTTGCSEYWRNSLALLEEHLLEDNYGSINLTTLSCFDPGPSQPMHTIPHTMPTIPQMMPLLTERQDMSSVRVKATYGNTTIKFPLPSGFSELEEEVSKRLEFERGSFKLEYKDEEGDSVLIACDEDVRDYLQLLTSLGNQVVKLFVLDKVPNTTNFCDNCKSLMCKRP